GRLGLDFDDFPSLICLVVISQCSMPSKPFASSSMARSTITKNYGRSYKSTATAFARILTRKLSSTATKNGGPTFSIISMACSGLPFGICRENGSSWPEMPWVSSLFTTELPGEDLLLGRRFAQFWRGNKASLKLTLQRLTYFCGSATRLLR